MVARGESVNVEGWVARALNVGYVWVLDLVGSGSSCRSK